jgi:hypothetical protein
VGWTAKEVWFDSWQVQEIFSVPKCPDQLWDPSSISLILRTHSPAAKQQGMKLTSYHNLVLRLRIGMELYACLHCIMCLNYVERDSFTFV